jgi:preprotein translocase subunit SecF
MTTRAPKKGVLRRIAAGETNFNIVGNARLWAIISGIVLLLSLIGIFVRHLNLGLEFEGGTSLTVDVVNTATVGDIEDALGKFTLGDVKIQMNTTTEGVTQALVRTKHIEDRPTLVKVQSALADAVGQKIGSSPNIDAVSIEDVGASWGKQVSNKALRGLIVFLVLVTLYISIRFEPKMAVGALLALFHDLLATAGIYALIGFEVTPATVIALLTLLGYSLYDTVVVFDKVQENVGLVGRAERTTYTEMVNRSLNQVLMRSINTSLSTILPIGALLFVGVYLFHAKTLQDLALALFMGSIVGAYSSIFVASPILSLLKEREPRYRNIRLRAAAEPRRVAPAAAGGVVPPMDDPADPEHRVTSGTPMRVQRPPARPRKTKKKKRR